MTPDIITSNELRKHIEKWGVEEFLMQCEHIFRLMQLETELTDKEESMRHYETWVHFRSIRTLLFPNSERRQYELGTSRDDDKTDP